MERIAALGYLRFCAGILCNFLGIPLAQFAYDNCSKLTVACIKLIVNFAKPFFENLVDFRFWAWYYITCRCETKHDLIAQLGEHHLDRVGVTGSIPVQITILKRREALIYKASFFFLNSQLIFSLSISLFWCRIGALHSTKATSVPRIKKARCITRAS